LPKSNEGWFNRRDEKAELARGEESPIYVAYTRKKHMFQVHEKEDLGGDIANFVDLEHGR
jgi:hypothetical protein